MPGPIEDVFAAASCAGTLCVQGVDPSHEVAVGADQPVVAASVIKVLIALAAESAFADGRLAANEPVLLAADSRTPGPVGFSLFADDATVSAGDLVSAALTISDNVAADALLTLVGIDACNRLTLELGLSSTTIVSDQATTIESIAHDAGFSDWQSMSRWSDGAPPAAERAAVDERVRACAALDPMIATRTTARDMCTLLRAIWENDAGPSAACARVRGHLRRQLTRNRLAAGFPSSSVVAAKSGGLMGVVRNEVGVVEVPGRQRIYAAVFTRASPGADGPSVDAAIGRAAAAAAGRLRS